MKYTTIYICEKCGQEFRDDEMCKEHEDYHIEPKDWDLKKVAQYSRDSKYPDTISIEMADGTTVMYYEFATSGQKENIPLATENSKED